MTRERQVATGLVSRNLHFECAKVGLLALGIEKHAYACANDTMNGTALEDRYRR
jgi:hypothetical protein